MVIGDTLVVSSQSVQAELAARDIQTLLKNVETGQWAMALKGASKASQDKIIENMSTRAAENLKGEMGYLGSVRISEVESTRQKIVDMVRTLEDNGEISRSTGETEEQYVN